MRWTKGRGALRVAVAAGTVVVWMAAAPPAIAAYPGPGPVSGDTRIHDPSMVRTRAGYLLLESHGNLGARTSPDRSHFTRADPVFPTVPAWVHDYSDGDVWAPDISYQRGRYWLYYAASTSGSRNSAIGLATSPSGRPGTFTDHGIVVSTTLDDDHNAIDPALLVDRQGRWWLVFGSFWSGIRMIRLDPFTGMPHPTDRTLHHLARRPVEQAVEAPYVIERGGYYYLFVSFDHCCRGVDSDYRIMVGRSASPTGPYVDRDGVPMLDGGGTQLLASHGDVRGPGGQSVLRDGDVDLLVYHYYDRADGGLSKVGLNQLSWDDEGWPLVT
ncbi:arabinan endo-1,5-alpha-L-arabinosidase [Actinoalloteichus spitiensis]|uniref:arabinan endo-1,5-alpha-L-arabinosidase n=1 Tax=Actinoalloteichus spitiensis TaxID=252394 RepID=UPI00037CB6E3|nr:arabinan endo-1,5-alpha-L-arabinosidase [Actinoalloteichus spitiensis]